jgi:aspartokinase-like uncharacterized kinase
VSRPRTVVIKVGGSLLGWDEFPTRLRDYLELSRSERVVLVMGGGRVADLVRELDSAYRIGEKRSHGLALRALDLTAHMVAALVPCLTVVERPEEVAGAWERGLVPVLAPSWFMENVDRHSPNPLDESWSVTSDSIAARAAELLGADELRLLKSAAPVGLDGRSAASRGGYLDPAFPGASAPFRRLAVVNLRGNPPTTDYLD